jgi:hypothetical protein
MSLANYYAQYQEFVTGKGEGNFTSHVAAEVAAAYEIGLTFEQLQRFLARRTEITSVAVALKGSTLPAEAIERILEARHGGAVSPKEVLERAFSKEEVHEKFHSEVFGATDA